VEAKEGAALRIHFSRIGCSINKQEMNGEGSYSLDLKRWVLAKGKLVVIFIIMLKNFEFLVYALIKKNNK
jgi:hypothetical protein